MQSNESNLSESSPIQLTDICNKSKKKIFYTAKGESIYTKVNNSGNFLYKFNSLIKDIFLPMGFPKSVSSDYLEYQIWDTCQAFCSSISGTFAMRAVLQGIGVGSEAVKPVSAAVTWLFKDGTGMIGSILFAWLKGSKLDSDCKKWRLFADILNDIALFLELYTPHVLQYSMFILCTATVFKALVGTAGSSTRAALLTHQAIKGNIADVSAKDGSQEIFINLCAFILGIFLLKNVTETKQIWTVMCTATLFHLIFNYKAVRCLRINVFNGERFRLCLRTYLPTSIVPTVQQTNERESVFLMLGISDYEVCGYSIVFGACLKKVINSPPLTVAVFSGIIGLFQSKKYIIMPGLKKKKLYVALDKSISETDILKAYFHATLLAISLNYLQKRTTLRVVSRCRKNSPIYRLKNILNELLTQMDNEENKKKDIVLEAYSICEDFVNKEFIAFCFLCEEVDWDISKHLINIGDWRTEWKQRSHEKKELSFRLVPSEKIITRPRSPRPPPPPPPPTSSPSRYMQRLTIS